MVCSLSCVVTTPAFFFFFVLEFRKPFIHKDWKAFMKYFVFGMARVWRLELGFALALTFPSPSFLPSFFPPVNHISVKLIYLYYWEIGLLLILFHTMFLILCIYIKSSTRWTDASKIFPKFRKVCTFILMVTFIKLTPAAFYLLLSVHLFLSVK